MEVIQIKIKVSLLGPLKKYKSKKLANSDELDIPEDYNIKDLINYLEIPEEKAKVILVNEENKKINYHLKESDRLTIFSFISGG